MHNRRAVTDRIHAYDFAMVELNLYLDTHPQDEQALCLFHMYRDKREKLVATYEAQFGPYVATVNDVQGDRFTWVNDPWPWEFCREA